MIKVHLNGYLPIFLKVYIEVSYGELDMLGILKIIEPVHEISNNVAF